MSEPVAKLTDAELTKKVEAEQKVCPFMSHRDEYSTIYFCRADCRMYNYNHYLGISTCLMAKHFC